MKIKFVLIIISLIIFIQCKVESNLLIIHYHRFNSDYEHWTLWSWLDEVQREIEPSLKDEFGLVFKVELNKYPPAGNISFLPKFQEWTTKDDPPRFWDRSLAREIWLLQGIATVFTEKPETKPSIRKAFVDAFDTITVVLTHKVHKKNVSQLNPVITLKDNSKLKPDKISITKDSSIIKLHLAQSLTAENLTGKIALNGYDPGRLILRNVLDNKQFITSEKLGIFICDDYCCFSVYAPGAKNVTLNIYDTPIGGTPIKYQLNKGSNGLWNDTVPGKLAGKYYTYQIEGDTPSYDPKVEVIDPYARCVTAHNGRGHIIEDHTDISAVDDFTFDQAVVYELHVRDFTIDHSSGVQGNGKFLGFTEKGTRIPGTNVATAVDHLVELGINTVQIMPVQDFENDEAGHKYNWGYMPVNFNSPDGWYASKTDDSSRVVEFKKLIDALHKRGIKVIMDVVYNHTAETSSQIKYNLNGFAPDFYYRQKVDGSYWNGSACGNEVRSENPMVRRFILESVKYWVETYGIDGYRFDLMGLMDIKTMETIVQKLRKIKPNCFIYGEPWTSGETPIEPTVKGTQRSKGFAVFNDHFRDGLKGPWYNTDPGYVQIGINVEAVKKGIMGSIDDFADSPLEVLNYVACHDGRTLWDQLAASTEKEASITIEQKISMHKLATAIVLTSQGIPFFHSGQEFLRSKSGSHNSYNQPDEINKIRWELKIKHHDVFDYIKDLIALRKAHPMFRMIDAQQIRQNLKFFKRVPDSCIGYRLSRGQSGDRWQEALVLINPNRTPATISIPTGEWKTAVDARNVNMDGSGVITKTEVVVEAISMKVLYRE
jgi:pullulanase